MFDPITAKLLRSAPGIPGLDPDDIPRILTEQYAVLVSARLRQTDGPATDEQAAEWSLERIADTYEIITSINADDEVRRSSAFVAATAHQILSRREISVAAPIVASVTRELVAPSIAAALLFLSAEQYADANEAASSIPVQTRGATYESRILADHIRDLATGNLPSILDRAERWRRPDAVRFRFEVSALILLLEALASGIELLAAEILNRHGSGEIASRFSGSREAFTRVMELSGNEEIIFPGIGEKLFTSYPGPRHLASLLIGAGETIKNAALTAVLPPSGADASYWGKCLQYRANNQPYIWPNHKVAIKEKFYETGVSAVLVLPTGAGKTTISSLKIAGALARGKKVVFLAPTHALVEQLTVDLQEIFPKGLLGAEVSNDFDLLAANDHLQEIEVMTPEGCLAMLSFLPDSFADVGLLVFDECHLLSPQSGKIRRSLDGMLCVLAFNHFLPDADFLFLSAMLDNGTEFAEWVEQLTGRTCVPVDLLWKPSRQARGVVIYSKPELELVEQKAKTVQTTLDKSAKAPAKGLRSAAGTTLLAKPYAIWGLQHNWLSKDAAHHCSLTSLSNTKVLLSGEYKRKQVRLKPNANKVAGQLAISAARNNLKTIVFVNTKAVAISTAHDVSQQLGETIEATELEKPIWAALEIELGGLDHSLLQPKSGAVPHNSSMFRLERDLAERMFRRPDGAKVIVATPTLAQGLNLPAQLAILAGDKRANAAAKGRENLEAHELLNAAARAGRAGHLANGVVLLIPEPLIHYTKGRKLGADVIAKLQSILPEDDRCVSITDPLEVVLDRLMAGEKADRDVKYTLNRMAALNAASDEDAVSIFNLRKSLGFYSASKRKDEHLFIHKIDVLKAEIDLASLGDPDQSLLILAAQSGLPADMLSRLREKISGQVGALPLSVSDWVFWTFDWLANDKASFDLVMEDIVGSMLAATGKKKSEQMSAQVLNCVRDGVIGWIFGKTVLEIEIILGGNPVHGSSTEKCCPRARVLVGTIIPRGLSYVLGLISHIVHQLNPYEAQTDLDASVVGQLSTAVRRGYDSVAKLQFALGDKTLISRVQAHRAWAARPSIFEIFV